MTSETNKIGYGSPPKKHQWKKGQTGNPKGRPKKKYIDFIAFGDEIFDEPVKTNALKPEDQILDILEANLVLNTQKALKGCATTLYKIIDMCLKYAPDMKPEQVRQIYSTAAARERLTQAVIEAGVFPDENGNYRKKKDVSKDE